MTNLRCCCSQISTEDSRILIDSGANLPGEDQIAETKDSEMFQKVFGSRRDGAVYFTHYHLYVDHSALDSYMFCVKVSGRTILFTGDFRDHGIMGQNGRLERVLKTYVQGPVDVLITKEELERDGFVMPARKNTHPDTYQSPFETLLALIFKDRQPGKCLGEEPDHPRDYVRKLEERLRQGETERLAEEIEEMKSRTGKGGRTLYDRDRQGSGESD